MHPCISVNQQVGSLTVVLFFCYDKDIINIMSRGPKKSGFNPVREYYRCPVKNCNSQFRGDEISRHFTKNANLDLLRAAMGSIEKRIEKKVAFSDIVLARYF